MVKVGLKPTYNLYATVFFRLHTSISSFLFYSWYLWTCLQRCQRPYRHPTRCFVYLHYIKPGIRSPEALAAHRGFLTPLLGCPMSLPPICYTSAPGVPGEARTLDPMIKSHVLYRLSYRHILKLATSGLHTFLTLWVSNLAEEHPFVFRLCYSLLLALKGTCLVPEVRFELTTFGVWIRRY